MMCRLTLFFCLSGHVIGVFVFPRSQTMVIALFAPNLYTLDHVLALADWYLAKVTANHVKLPPLPDDSDLHALRQYRRPGKARDLRNVT